MRENTGDGGIFLGQILIVEEDTNYEWTVHVMYQFKQITCM